MLLRLFLLASLLVAYSGCDNDKEARFECRNVTPANGFTKDDLERCVRDPAFRSDALAKIDRDWAESTAAGIGKYRDLLRPSDAVRAKAMVMDNIFDRPFSAKGSPNQGKIFKAQGSIEVNVNLNDEKLEARDAIVQVDAFRQIEDSEIWVRLDAMNRYQSRFLARFCYPDRVCRGTIYFQIDEREDDVLAGAELLGADLDLITPEEALKAN